ncbi:MAG TPA: hypothetical protein VF765_00505 [Polyangiaceae bacterium]
MARQGMLNALALVAMVAVAGTARAQTDEPEGLLRRPERLTVAVADELLGQLSPDGRTLYFVSSRNTMSQVFAEIVADGRAKPLFDDDADVTWPRVSPDGRRLLYISFADSVLGQLCVRDLPDGKERRCLARALAAVQAEWVDGSRIVLVSRESIEGDLRVLDVNVGSALSARPLLDRNLTGPAVSPDGQWLVYVPIQRDVATVGPAFAAHAGRRLEVVRLKSPGAPATSLSIDLPGLTGQPAFARDGRWIYFVQFLDDSNHDGVVDASDDGILFRVPFSAEGDRPAVGAPRQLTETTYNCEYPAPAADRLVATCAQDRALAIYALPLDGEVPDVWGTARLAAEIETAGTKAEQQLLSSRRLSLETTTSGRRIALLDLLTRDLDLEYNRAAEFYAQHVVDQRDRSTMGLSSAVLALVAQRRAERERERGVMVQEFRDRARQRLDDLRLPQGASPVATALAHVVRSEIADSIGDETRARSELEAASLDASAPAPVVDAYYERADALYRELDDREALVAACRRLSENDGLGADQRLRYAQAAVRAMVRGLPRDAAAARLEHEHAGTPAGSELAFAIDLAHALLAMRDSDPLPAVTEEILALYAQQVRPERRASVVDEVVHRAREVGAGGFVESVVQRYLDDSRPGTRERLDAERRFRGVMTARALRQAAEGHSDEARADFDAIVGQTGSYESAVASIDLRLRAGESPAVIDASYVGTTTAKPLSDFAKAYVLARELPALGGDDEARATAQALALVRASWVELRNQRVAQALDGALLHEEYIRAGNPALAEQANAHYVVALEAARPGTPFRAMVLDLLGILHTQVGNWRIALDYLEERDKLPYPDDAAALGVRLALARSLLHVDRAGDAAGVADAAMAMAERTPDLAAYRTVVRDRDAVSNLAAGRFGRALALYDAQIPSIDAATGPAAARNRFVAHLGRAAAAVGAGRPNVALSELDALERQFGDPARAAELRWGHAPLTVVIRGYRLIAEGLRASAYRELGRPDDEARAIEERRAILAERFAATKRTEYELATMLAETQLALNAADRRDAAAAASWLQQALAHADDLLARAHGQVDGPELDVLWAAAQIGVSMGTNLVPDLAPRLKAALAAIASRPQTDLGSYSRRFEVFLTLTAPPRASR